MNAPKPIKHKKKGVGIVVPEFTGIDLKTYKHLCIFNHLIIEVIKIFVFLNHNHVILL